MDLILLCCIPDTTLILEYSSEIVSIVTGFILLFWFLFTQWELLSSNYFSSVVGSYAGFFSATEKTGETGMLLKINRISESGYYDGEFDIREMSSFDSSSTDNITFDGNFLCKGKMNYCWHLLKDRNPYDVKQNRVYKGTFFVVDRFDFDFENVDFENYVSAEYEVIHYREMEVLKFVLKKKHRGIARPMPDSFTLYKRKGVMFEPYSSVKKLFFPRGSRLG